MYIGTKIVHLSPMSKREYCAYRNWALPPNEDPAEDGYLVEYTDGGKPNDPRHAGYISWSPKVQADAAYRHCDALTFGLAVEALRKGLKIRRAGWNGKGMWLKLVGFAETGANYDVFADAEIEALDAMLPWIGMKTADNCFVPWLASQTDVLAEDWEVLP